jgi:hypothetical protein
VWLRNWKLKQRNARRLKTAEINLRRRSEWYSLLDRRRNEDILEEAEVEPVEKKLAQYKQKWLNHVSRMEDSRYTKQLLDYRPVGTRRPGQPKETTGRIQSWGRNKSFIGVSYWSEEEEDIELVSTSDSFELPLALPWRWRQKTPPKCWYGNSWLHSVTRKDSFLLIIHYSHDIGHCFANVYFEVRGWNC